MSPVALCNTRRGSWKRKFAPSSFSRSHKWPSSRSPSGALATRGIDGNFFICDGSLVSSDDLICIYDVHRFTHARRRSLVLIVLNREITGWENRDIGGLLGGCPRVPEVHRWRETRAVPLSRRWCAVSTRQRLVSIRPSASHNVDGAEGSAVSGPIFPVVCSISFSKSIVMW